jgi:subtilisin family serine protease
MQKLLIIILGFFTYQLTAQTQDAWVYFTDKPESSYYLNNPLEMLSQRALDRRITQAIPLDFLDVPLHNPYIQNISEAEGIVIIAQSKWLNGVHVQGLEEDISALLSESFVESIEFLDQSLNSGRINGATQENISQRKWGITTDFNYGNATNQIEMLGGDFLHQNDYTGEGMQIAVIDAGFTNVNTMGAFQRIRDNNQIAGTYNFVDDIEDVYLRHSHGTSVLSTIAGYVENEYVGTAPDAQFYLFITEDATQEHPLEESLWVEAAEYADSLGIDVLNTSLGYTEFDNPAYNHTYEDLNGQTTTISKGAEIAFSKGMLVINSAGNSGNNAWHYIGAPADAPSILSIGAVDASGSIASFSSYGPTYDGRVKPDVCAQGSGSALINTSNVITSGSGTSFSGPILAGVATCFWQAFPEKTNQEIAQSIRESAHLYNTPDDQYGYGIPNFESAFDTLKNVENNISEIIFYPNPVINNFLYYQNNTTNKLTHISISDTTGKVLTSFYSENSHLVIDTSVWAQGVYYFTVINSAKHTTHKILIP